MTDSRAAALAALMAVDRGELSDVALNAVVTPDMERRDRALATELVYGTLENQPGIDTVLKEFSGRPLKRLDPPVRAILRMTAYQLLFLDKIPPFAAINEAARLAARRCPRAKGYINGVLRSLERSRDRLPPMKEWSMSEGLEAMLREQYGDFILRRFNMRAKLQLRVNALKIDADRLCERLGARPTATDGVVELEGAAIRELPGFDEGLFFVEGRASAEAVAALNPKPGQAVLDLCASPGGKSFAAALHMCDRGSIESRDLTQAKIARIDESVKRLGFTCIRTVAADATVYDGSLADRYDCVICDVPCSGLGVMAKKPEIRLKEPAQFEELPSIQLAILQNAARYLKSGGRLLYSTCTLNLAENRRVVAAFLKEAPQFEIEVSQTILPSSDLDGFYFCILTRRAHA